MLLSLKKNFSFFLIDEILNRLINVVYFIKFDFKDMYYQIKIYKNNE